MYQERIERMEQSLMGRWLIQRWAFMLSSSERAGRTLNALTVPTVLEGTVDVLDHSAWKKEVEDGVEKWVFPVPEESTTWTLTVPENREGDIAYTLSREFSLDATSFFVYKVIYVAKGEIPKTLEELEAAITVTSGVKIRGGYQSEHPSSNDTQMIAEANGILESFWSHIDRTVPNYIARPERVGYLN